MPLPLDLLSHPIWASLMMAGIITVLIWRSELSASNVFSDPRLHHLSGCAGLAQGHGLPQHHAVRVTACPGHLSPLHGLLSHTQSKYQKISNKCIIDAAEPQVNSLVERYKSIRVVAIVAGGPKFYYHAMVMQYLKM